MFTNPVLGINKRGKIFPGDIYKNNEDSCECLSPEENSTIKSWTILWNQLKYIKVQGIINTWKGWINGEADGIDRDGEIDTFN